MDEFNTFINSLPDAGQVIKIVYDTMDSQVYGTFLTMSQLANVRKNSIVDLIERNWSGVRLMVANTDPYFSEQSQKLH